MSYEQECKALVIIEYTVITLVLALAVTLAAWLFDNFDTQQEEIRKANACIERLVLLDVERRDIEVHGAHCWVKQ
ncbi:MAG: hypothetical protein Unbinned4336contig1000_10 [Prokaryotic dsDNA virus sp.]|nr:MAG: hypothetical protein Unbinned4336contig1000_10 [Prokaryotic dsDNA virus sp.]|tara:strand:- start:36077 stop:36301 length:225 start_codon:yes stop_codon:yes gene_type:complete